MKIEEISRETRNHAIKNRSGTGMTAVGLSWEVKTEVVKGFSLNPGGSEKVEQASQSHGGTLSGQCLNQGYERMVQGYCEAIMSSCRPWIQKREKSPPVAEAGTL